MRGTWETTEIICEIDGDVSLILTVHPAAVGAVHMSSSEVFKLISYFVKWKFITGAFCLWSKYHLMMMMMMMMMTMIIIIISYSICDIVIQSLYRYRIWMDG